VLALAMTGAPCLAAEAGDTEAVLHGSPLEHLAAADYGQFYAIAQQVAGRPAGASTGGRAPVAAAT
jgi:hypothetical protein